MLLFSRYIKAAQMCLHIDPSTAYAEGEFLKKDLNLLYYDNGRLCPCWIENGELSQMITESLYEQRYSVNYRSKQTDFMANTMLRGLSRKLYVAFSPRAVIRPFIIVEELQNALFTIRSKASKPKIQIDEKYQAKSAQLTNQIAKLKKIKKRKPLAFSPYYNRIYGVYLEITW